MSTEGPSVVDLNKSEEDDDSDGEDDAKSAVSEEAGETYPDDVEAETPDSGDSDDDATTKTDDEREKTLTEKLGLSFKLDHDDEFTDIRQGDTILIDTPIEGSKVGKVVDRTETWTGITQATVDTGASEYTVTPFDDEFSSKFVASVEETMDLTQKVLERLEPASIEDVESGDNVVLDCPEIGPTRAQATDIVESANQGRRGTFKAGDCYFVVYEEPTPIQTKEQPYIVGREK